MNIKNNKINIEIIFSLIIKLCSYLLNNNLFTFKKIKCILICFNVLINFPREKFFLSEIIKCKIF